jgi:hypothetical protein
VVAVTAGRGETNYLLPVVAGVPPANGKPPADSPKVSRAGDTPATTGNSFQLK